ncbi:hypothetical protein EW026_g1142 [Hermanssonia centrifuga]|uniref:Phytanoyl-CoA dioxygenase n=1 Tax=Hermanssonia centrifuga TaxID=98765 RepID=A0A4S4KSL5_9APHY|nr:hypothetical protein EW026_g1142 [Hermanssonia centrifuga]
MDLLLLIMEQEYKMLTAEQIDFFLENGYVVIKQAFTKEKADAFTKNIWVRLGMDPNDKSTWNQERVHMPPINREKVATFAPKAWEAIKELLGGEDRIDEQASTWGDSFIVNFGTPALEGAPTVEPPNLDNWHVDGDFFIHFLDSPEQALLVIPIFSDIKPRGGGTYIAPDDTEGTRKIKKVRSTKEFLFTDSYDSFLQRNTFSAEFKSFVFLAYTSHEGYDTEAHQPIFIVHRRAYSVPAFNGQVVDNAFKLSTHVYQRDDGHA